MEQRSIITKLSSFIVIGLIFLLTTFSLSIPSANAVDNNLSTAQQKILKKISKNYSNKFCNAIGIGLSVNSAAKLAIGENKDPRFNPALWLDLAISGEKEIIAINQSDLAFDIATNIERDCGAAIGVKGNDDIERLREYFISMEETLNN